MLTLTELCCGLPLDPLPPYRSQNAKLPHAPCRNVPLNKKEKRQALANALRYFPPTLHHILAPEFAQELRFFGHIYMYRFIPRIEMRAYSIDEYPAKNREAAAMMLMIMNNLDPNVAQFPEELVTYGGNGQVFSNWAQFWLMMHYLSQIEDGQTLVVYSGHPMGLFPSIKGYSPRAIITTGMVVPNYSSATDYDKMFALGVSLYGQMTAGSYCYIGPQGIVHGTTITVKNAGRKYLKLESLAGKVFLTSGLGGMSGAQAKASVIAGAIGVIAEVSKEALLKRYNQGWLNEYETDLKALITKIRLAKQQRVAISIGYLGNVVDLWEYLVAESNISNDILVDLGSDQTSCHNPFNGGYYPVGLTFEESNRMMVENPKLFKDYVRKSLVRHINAINILASKGLCFWDYGNAFLLEASHAGADVGQDGLRFRYPSYVQDIMGDIFSLGFGPFRWVCTSGDPSDLQKTDLIAGDVLRELIKTEDCRDVRQQYQDNLIWIEQAGANKLVVGSQARIFYLDRRGRIKVSQEFNEAVANGTLKGPVVISRDHHDVSGGDSPFRETSNIYDGSAFTADMAVHNFVGDAFRGASWVALHNGGGVGWGKAINGGFGMLLDGSQAAKDRAAAMLSWDVNNGVSRRCWSGNEHARNAIERAMKDDPRLKVTLPHACDPTLATKTIDSIFNTDD